MTATLATKRATRKGSLRLTGKKIGSHYIEISVEHTLSEIRKACRAHSFSVSVIFVTGFFFWWKILGRRVCCQKQVSCAVSVNKIGLRRSSLVVGSVFYACVLCVDHALARSSVPTALARSFKQSSSRCRTGPHITCMMWDAFPGLDLYYTDPAQRLRTAGKDRDLDNDPLGPGVSNLNILLIGLTPHFDQITI